MGGVRRVDEWYKVLVEGYFMKVSYESIHRIKNPKPFENGFEGLTEFIRFENEHPWI
jgi:hypothetical protein